jgi:two-component system sensor histidine kinase FlrB
VVGDRKAVAGALTNLLENAVQALEAGGEIRFDARLDGPVARFAVADNGRGIEPALQSRLFEPFFTTRPDGTGLGLAIARGVARAHGGDIRIDSAPGRGTTFTLTLAMGA